jgi:hypothetical protein
MDAETIARRVAQARRLVAEINDPDPDGPLCRKPYFLLGQAEFVIQSLIEIIDPDGEMP